MTDLSPAAQAVRFAYGDCIGGVDAVMGSEWRGLAAALRAAADQLTPYTVSEMTGAAFARNKILAIANELENNG